MCIVTTVRLFIEGTQFKWAVSDIIIHFEITDSLKGLLNRNRVGKFELKDL